MGLGGSGCGRQHHRARGARRARRHPDRARVRAEAGANRILDGGSDLVGSSYAAAINVGTNPTNAEQMFLALDGLGKPAALYMYPFEGHGPLAKETTHDLWARWTMWLDTYVKNPKKETPRAGAPTTERSGGD